MTKNLGHEPEDRGVESVREEVTLPDGEVVTHMTPPVLDGIGEPAAPEDDLGGD